MLEFDKLKNLQKIITGRDMVGIRPLYYCPNENTEELLFTSELKGGINFDNTLIEFPPGTIINYSINSINDFKKGKI